MSVVFFLLVVFLHSLLCWCVSDFVHCFSNLLLWFVCCWFFSPPLPIHGHIFGFALAFLISRRVAVFGVFSPFALAVVFSVFPDTSSDVVLRFVFLEGLFSDSSLFSALRFFRFVNVV